MGLESPTTIYDLNRSWPTESDFAYEGDDHLRQFKGAVIDTFLAGSTASRPAAGTAGRYYFDTDVLKIYRDTGSKWQEFYAADGGIVTGDKTFSQSDHGRIFFLDSTSGDITLTTPAAVTAGSSWHITLIKIVDANDVILKDNAATELARLYYSGEVLVPITNGSSWYMHYRNEVYPTFLVKKTGTQALPSSTDTKVTWDSTLYNLGSMFAANAGTIRKPGIYRCRASLVMDRDSGSEIDQCALMLYKNALSDQILGYLSTDENAQIKSTSIFLEGSVEFEAAADDDFEIYASQQTGGSFTIRPQVEAGVDSAFFSLTFVRRL